jgi:hypothetical protein
MVRAGNRARVIDESYREVSGCRRTMGWTMNGYIWILNHSVKFSLMNETMKQKLPDTGICQSVEARIKVML